MGTRHSDNTLEILFEREKEAHFSDMFVFYVVRFAGSLFIAMVLVVLFYEVPCTIGKNFDVDSEIVKKALYAEKIIKMKHRTQVYTVDKVLHELEEMKVFYSSI